MGVSAQVFRKRFAALMGMTPAQFQLQGRLDQSQELLLAQQMSMAEIASVCGFCDAYHFSRMFKKYRGMNPSAYRQHHGLAPRSSGKICDVT